MRLALRGEIFQVVQSGKQLEIQDAGKKSVRTFVTPEQAAVQRQRLVDERLADGWEPATRDPRHSALEQAIATDPESPEVYSVYGDWLESQGDPRGKLIALGIAAKAEDSGKLATAFGRALREDADYFIGPLAGEQITWRFGFIHRAYIGSNLVEPLLRHPSARFLVALGVSHVQSQREVIDLVARLAPASLRELALRPVYGLDLAELWPRMPLLRRLSLVGERLVLGDLALPRLEQLDLEDREMPDATARMLSRAPWPVLRDLRIDLGQGLYTGSASIDEIFALLARRDLPALTSLTLHHTRHGGEVIRELVASPLAAQLEKLDLAFNLLTDAHALELARHRDRFGRLATLDVSNNELTDKGIEALRSLAARLDVRRRAH